MKKTKKRLRAKIWVKLPCPGRDLAILDDHTNNIIYLDRDGTMSIEHVSLEETRAFKTELYRRKASHRQAHSRPA